MSTLTHPEKLAEAAKTLMKPEWYPQVLAAAESGSRSTFNQICDKDHAKIDPDLVNELWAAAAGTQSTEALSRYPGSAGW